MADPGERRAVALLGLGVDATSGASLMVLRELADGRRALPIWIGAAEAQAIGVVIVGQPPPRPLTHQLIVNVLGAVGPGLREAAVIGFEDGVFHAELVLDNEVRISARPSDAVPVALAAGVPLYVTAAVLAQAAVPLERVAGGAFTDSIPDAPTEGARSPDAAPPAAEIDEEAARLRSWLDAATVEDFTTDPDQPTDPEHPGPDGPSGSGE